MSADLDEVGYEQTKRKLASLEHRLKSLEQRADLNPAHLAETRRSYQEMMRQYTREIKLYEAKRPHDPHSTHTN
jgi:hypothetical protein